LAASCHYAATLRDDHPWAGSITPDYPVGSLTVEAMLKRDVGNLHTSTWVLRRREPLKWGRFRSSSFGDYPILVWTLLQGSARVVPRVWSLYRIHGQGVFSPLSDENRLRENVELWKCLESIVPAELHTALAIGTSRTLIMYTGALRKAGKYDMAFGCFRKVFSEIARVRSCAAERRQLRLLAIESLVFPYLSGLRRRWRERQLRN
jgi:hypothetical protein